MKRILLIEGDNQIAEQIENLFSEDDEFELHWRQDLSSARVSMGRTDYSLLILDLDLPGTTVDKTLPELCRETQKPIIAISSRASPSDAVTAVQNGAEDFYQIDKIAPADRFLQSIEFAIVRSRLKEELKEQSEVLKEVLDNAGEGIIFADQDSNFSVFNRTAGRLLGVSETADRPEEWADVYGFYKKDETSKVATFDLPLVRVLCGTTVINDHLYIKNANQKSGKHVKCTGSPFSNGGGVLLIRDITEEVKSKSSFETAATKLENTNLELSQFAYRTSHDLKAPLITVRCLAEAIIEDIADNNPADILKNAHSISKCVKSLENLVNDILNLTRVDVKVTDVEKLDLNEIVNEIKLRLESIYLDNDVVIRTNIDPSVSIVASRTRVAQSIENLVSNSIKYSDQCKESRYVEISNCAGDSYNSVTVSDNGLGIPAEFQDRVFGMFERFHPTVSAGSGLGMYILKKNIDHMNSEISYESSSAGTDFKIKFFKGNCESAKCASTR